MKDWEVSGTKLINLMYVRYLIESGMCYSSDKATIQEERLKQSNVSLVSYCRVETVTTVNCVLCNYIC